MINGKRPSEVADTGEESHARLTEQNVTERSWVKPLVVYKTKLCVIRFLLALVKYSNSNKKIIEINFIKKKTNECFPSEAVWNH